METRFFLEGLLIGVIVSIPVGPMGIYIVQKTLVAGRESGFLSGLGAVTADVIFSVVAAASMSLVISFIEEKQLFFQLTGGIVVTGIGIKIYTDNPLKTFRKPVRSKGKRFIDDYLTFILLVLSNPLTLLLYVGIFASLHYPKEISFLSGPGLTIFGIICSATLWWFLLTYYLDKFRKKIKLRKIFWFNKIAGIGIILFGIVVLSSILVARL